MSDLENKIGDHSSTRISLPHRMQVRVHREGTEIHLFIGNSDPFKFEYADAMRQGMVWVKEGHAAVRENRLTFLQVKTGKMYCDGKSLVAVGQWMLAKGSEAKFLSGDRARLQT